MLEQETKWIVITSKRRTRAPAKKAYSQMSVHLLCYTSVMNSQSIFDYERYMLIIAHPDDEINCSVLLKNLLNQSKKLKILLITDGDAGMNASERGKEMIKSISAIGLKEEDLIQLNVSEKELLDKAPEVLSRALSVASEYKADCILGLDYEGGHEGHDMSCFIANRISQSLGVAHIVYPDYHFRDMHRHGQEFLPERHIDYTIGLNDNDKDLKITVVDAHRGQIGFHLRIQKYQDNYFSLLLDREIYRVFPSDYNFLDRPSYQIGYEYHRNGFKFSDFVEAIKDMG